ncbi:hypothetical protein CAter10_0951 [Collimonas arenae]|nr:hypothetical protein CAter10_0951 [Collimonas arenae]
MSSPAWRWCCWGRDFIDAGCFGNIGAGGDVVAQLSKQLALGAGDCCHFDVGSDRRQRLASGIAVCTAAVGEVIAGSTIALLQSLAYSYALKRLGMPH